MKIREATLADHQVHKIRAHFEGGCSNHGGLVIHQPSLYKIPCVLVKASAYSLISADSRRALSCVLSI
jgi:hypothetical protein